MIKPDIKRLFPDPNFPQKEAYTEDELRKFFIGQDIIILEKFDGKAHYDKDLHIFLEDLHHKGKDHLIKYHTYRWMFLAIEHNGDFFPAVDEFLTINPYDDLTDKMWERYNKWATHQPLFRGRCITLNHFKMLLTVLRTQKSQYHNSRDGAIEGLVVWSGYQTQKWGKIHTDWFSNELKRVTEEGN